MVPRRRQCRVGARRIGLGFYCSSHLVSSEPRVGRAASTREYLAGIARGATGVVDEISRPLAVPTSAEHVKQDSGTGSFGRHRVAVAVPQMPGLIILHRARANVPPTSAHAASPTELNHPPPAPRSSHTPPRPRRCRLRKWRAAAVLARVRVGAVASLGRHCRPSSHRATTTANPRRATNTSNDRSVNLPGSIRRRRRRSEHKRSGPLDQWGRTDQPSKTVSYSGAIAVGGGYGCTSTFDLGGQKRVSGR